MKREERVSWFWWLLLLFFVLGMAIWNLGQAPLSDAEAFYAEAAREMHERKEWLIPYFNYARFFDKPPLYYWLEIVSYNIFGVTEFASRLPAATAFAGIIGLTALAGKVLFDDITGLIAGFIFSSAMGFYLYSHMVLVEPVLAFFIVGALVAFLLWYKNSDKKHYLYIAYACMALAMLTKGLTGIVFPFVTITAFLIVTNSKKYLKQFFNPKEVLCFIVIVLPWHLWVAITNKGFFWFYFIHEQLLRFINHRQITDASLGTFPFLGTLLLILFPWSLFLFPALLFYFSEWRKQKSNVPLNWFLILWATVVIGFFCLSKSKLEYYSLPAWPALILLAANYWRRQIALQCNSLQGIKIPLIILVCLTVIGLAIINFPSLFRLSIDDKSISSLFNINFAQKEAMEIFQYLKEESKLSLSLLLAASGIALVSLRMRRPLLSLLCLGFVMFPVFGLAQKGVLLFEPFFSSHAAAKKVSDCLQSIGSGKIIHEKTDEDIYIGGVTFYTKHKVLLLKQKDKQRFPFPFEPEEIYYIAPDEFARLWNSHETVIFVGNIQQLVNLRKGNNALQFYLIETDKSKFSPKQVFTNTSICGATIQNNGLSK